MRIKLASLFTAAATLILGIGAPGPAIGDDDAGQNPLPTEQRSYQKFERFSVSPIDGKRTFYTYGITATSGFVNPVPYLLNRTQKKFCPTLDAVCYTAGDDLDVLGYLPQCSASNQAPCIAGVEASKGREGWVRGESLGFTNLTPKESDFDFLAPEIASSPEKVFLDKNTQVSWVGNGLVPAGATGALKMRFPGIENAAGTDTYAIKSVYDFQVRQAKGKYADFFTNVIPYVEGALSYADTSVTVLWHAKGSPDAMWPGQRGATGDGTKFAWSEHGKLGYAAAFPQNTRFRVTLQLPNEIGGWLHGRINDPQIQLSPINDTVSRLTVEAAPAMVPVTSAWEPIYDNGAFNPLANWLSPELKQRIIEDDAAGRFGATGPMWEPRPGAMEEFKRHQKMLGDRAKGQASVWSIAAIGDAPAPSTCLGKPGIFHGLVTTDAMVYQPGVPEFKGGFLSYQVGGVHRNWKNEVIQGSYDLVLRSASARCLYGFSSAPISATISVVNDAGENIVASTLVSEKDGWLKLSARGFTFSEKTIKVRLTQAKPAVSTTIVCSKGKVQRVISAVNPTCPSGFILQNPKAVVSITCIKGNQTKVVKGPRPVCPKGFTRKK
jgi:hypothetical protein